MSPKIKIIRSTYLYLASLISLLFIAIGSYNLINTAIKYYLLPEAEKGGFSRCNQQPPVYGLDFSAKSLATEEQKSQIDQLIRDYQKWKEENSGEKCYKAERQNNIANAITMIIIALPIFLFHWQIIKKEKEERDNS